MPFPTAGILDDFNRANAGNLGASWTDMQNGWDIVSNQAAPGVAAQNETLWSASAFGPASEVYLDVVTKPPTASTLAVFIRATTLISATIDSYLVLLFVQSVTDDQQIYRGDNGVYTQLGANITDELNNGEGFGAEMIGSTIALYNRVAGVWTQLATRSDATYAAAGYIGIRSNSTAVRIDNFGGGTVVSGSSAALLSANMRGNFRNPSGRFING